MSWTNQKRAVVHMRVDISTQKERINTLENQIIKDSMTGIYNHTYAVQSVQQLVQNKQDFSICYIDLDGLKVANDLFGHKWGDNYILKFVEIIQNTLHIDNLFCRIGGDEFIIIFPYAGFERASNALDEIVNNLVNFNEKKIFPFELSFSYGIETFNPDIHIDQKTIFDRADKKMYLQKK